MLHMVTCGHSSTSFTLIVLGSSSSTCARMALFRQYKCQKKSSLLDCLRSFPYGYHVTICLLFHIYICGISRGFLCSSKRSWTISIMLSKKLALMCSCFIFVVLCYIIFMDSFFWAGFFSSPEHFCAQGELLWWPIVRRPSSVRPCINNFFKQHLLWNHLLDFDQTSQVWSLGYPLSKLFKPFQLVV